MKNEIFRAFFLTFGIFEIITNSTYLLKQNGIALARKQHQELPKDVTNIQMRIKVICVLLVGVLFFCIGLFSYITQRHYENAILIGLGFMAIYAILEAVYYRYIKTFGFAAISIGLLCLYIFL